MENLNAEQVKKWLEICAEDTPYPDQSQALLAALALINSQEQRIKELTQVNEQLSESYDHLKKTKDELLSERARLTEENERLKKNNAVLIEDNHILATEFKEITIADTVRKMHSEIKERCIEGGIYPAFVASTIDRVAKEMLEGGH